MRRAVRWLTYFLPPTYVVVIAVLFYFSIEYLAWLSAGNWQQFLLVANNPNQELFRVRDIVLVVGAALYGKWRVVAFHPFYRQSYSDWLELTPWTSRYPLPRGAIHLVAQDLLVAAILVTAMHTTATARQYVPVMLLAAHSASIGIALFFTGPRWMAYAVGLLLGCLLLAAKEPNAALALALGTSIVAHAGLRISLSAFPWIVSESLKTFLLALSGQKSETQKNALGFPFDGLSPRAPDPSLPLSDGIALSLLPAWWAFAVMGLTPKPEDIAPLVGMVCGYGLPVCVIGRAVTYLATCRPPISLWGRIMTGRWIIPLYDQALLAPVLATVLGFGLFCLGIGHNISIRLLAPACIAAVLLVTLNMGPSLSVWRLTGGYRLVPSRDRKNLIEL